MKKLLFLVGLLFLSSCGTYQLANLQPVYYSRPNVIVEPPTWGNFWFYNRTYTPYYIPPRVIVVESKPRVKGRRSTTTTPNRRRNNQTRSTYKKRN